MSDAEMAVMIHNIYMRGIYNTLFSMALALWIMVTFNAVVSIFMLLKVVQWRSQ